MQVHRGIHKSTVIYPGPNIKQEFITPSFHFVLERASSYCFHSIAVNIFKGIYLVGVHCVTIFIWISCLYRLFVAKWFAVYMSVFA